MSASGHVRRRQRLPMSAPTSIANVPRALRKSCCAIQPRRIRERFDSRFGNKIVQNNEGTNAGMRLIVFLDCLAFSKRYAPAEIPSTIVFKIETVRGFSFGLEPTAPRGNRSGVSIANQPSARFSTESANRRHSFVAAFRRHRGKFLISVLVQTII
jgi:hypothetical protein